VKGVGEKTASTLLQEYGSLAALRAAATDPASGLAKGVRAKLVDAGEYLDAAVPVVRVATDAPVRVSRPDPIPVTPVDPEGLERLAQDLGIGRSVARLTAAVAGV
ncbi:5'-3' exonuclease H3TH domain-containing protein, partial [Rhodococcus sp. CSLK01-03]|nr:5'-3' exonuclease H3TH domain-containing protein [Rhodococcus indonesiensis]